MNDGIKLDMWETIEENKSERNEEVPKLVTEKKLMEECTNSYNKGFLLGFLLAAIISIIMSSFWMFGFSYIL